MGWDEPFLFCGHSRGSNIGICAVGGFPHRFVGSIIIEGGLGMYGTYIGNRKDVGMTMGR